VSGVRRPGIGNAAASTCRIAEGRVKPSVFLLRQRHVPRALVQHFPDTSEAVLDLTFHAPLLLVVAALRHVQQLAHLARHPRLPGRDPAEVPDDGVELPVVAIAHEQPARLC